MGGGIIEEGIMERDIDSAMLFGGWYFGGLLLGVDRDFREEEREDEG